MLVNNSILIFFGISLIYTTFGYVTTTEDCLPCHSIDCPTTDYECFTQTRVDDPCGCCTDGVCPAQETEPCTHARPCERGYFCHKDMNSNDGVCRCRRDKRAVCSTENITYISICDLERQPHKPKLLKWGHCDQAPKIVSASGDTIVIPGQPVALDCEVKGSPVPTVMWYFVSKEGSTKVLPSDDQVTAILVRGGPENMMVTSWMQIVEARASDAGTYTCVATNDYGVAKHKAAINIIRKHY